MSNEHYNITEDGLITTVPTEEQIERYKEIVAGYPKSKYHKNGTSWSECSIAEIDAAVSALKKVRVLGVAGKNKQNNILVTCSCPLHGVDGYKGPTPLSVLLDTQGGNHCSLCQAECYSAYRIAKLTEITNSFVGQTTPDGHLILEHVGYRQSATSLKRGGRGDAKYRYRCNVCGNESSIAQGHNLKRPNYVVHCGCLSARDSRLTFSKSEAKSTAPCFVYVYSVLNNSGIKVGIAKNVQARASKSYEQQLFVSQAMPRANAWAVEQVLLHKLRSMGLQYDLTGTEAFSGREGGASEVFYSTQLTWVIDQINDLIAEVEAIGWQQLLDRYIPLEKMTSYQLLFWDEGRMRQSSGEGYIGFDFIQQFASLQEALSQ